MSDRPRYLWLSVIAFGIINYQCRNKILRGKETDYNLWFSYLRYSVLWGIITLIIPAGVIVFLMHILSAYSAEARLFVNIAGLVYLYFGGVMLAFKLYDWKGKNLK